MPIGTTSTAILLNINKPKHTRTSNQQENKSFWWEILERQCLVICVTYKNNYV
ncbi:hypothetical protein [Spiroplasma endosymbiont of Amphimallon solstitiale]|uniref:hypothetical protein n=1 Tax=Spiroplasma endosymbiont of Amphimallon solstitiale TaxID=3066288 RepID=UPI00313EA389